MTSSQHNKYWVENTHAYWFYTRGSSISSQLIAHDFRDEFWGAVLFKNRNLINELLLSHRFRRFLERGFNAIHPHGEPVFEWSHVNFKVSSIIPQGFERTHDVVDGKLRDFYITRSGFWAESADGRHQIMFMFCWLPNEDPNPQSIQIRYIGPQRFHTCDSEFYRLMQENMQGPHSR